MGQRIMQEADFLHGVIVRGAPSSQRKVCRCWDAAFTAFLGGDAASDAECYLSAFTYPADFVKHVKAHGFAGYGGPMWARYIPLDFDCEENPLAAIEAAQGFLRWLEGAASADLSAVIATFSGWKGAHIRLPIGGIHATPSPDFPKVCKAFAMLLARAAGAAHLDKGIYDAARILRLPNTRHPKTGRLSVPFSGEDFAAMKPEAIIAAGAGDRRDAVPVKGPDETWANWELQHFWNRASDWVTRQAAAVPVADGRVYLNRATMDFIREGACNGQRHQRLFQSAANLGEFGASERLARALLFEAARDSGLPVKEIESTIESGVKHGRKGAGL